jgi:membrane protein YqaA with SNARE-associated domain
VSALPQELPPLKVEPERPSAWYYSLVRPRGTLQWDWFLRATGVVALVAIPIAAFVPDKIPLVWFVLVSLPACGPWSPILPVAFEPLIFEIAKYEPPLVVAPVALCICVYTEFVNWHIYRWVVGHDRLQAVRDHRLVQLGVKYFSRAPFWTVAILATGPFPFWTLRILAILKHYPLRRFLTAMAIGRTPRLLVLAWLGSQLKVSSVILIGVVLFAALAAVIVGAGRRRRS